MSGLNLSRLRAFLPAGICLTATETRSFGAAKYTSHLAARRNLVAVSLLLNAAQFAWGKSVSIISVARWLKLLHTGVANHLARNMKGDNCRSLE